MTLLKNVVAASVGSYFEWFDLMAYAYFAVTISALFFPSSDPNISIILSFMAFASAYLIRPLGALFIGAYADKKGRKAAMTLTLSLMLLGTLLLAILPTYASIGLAAPVLLVLGRLLQGFSAGGEFGSANSYLTELTRDKKALLAGLQFSTSGLALLTAALIALLVNHFLSPAALAGWGWRVPFIFGCLLAPVCLYIRASLDETQEFEHLEPGVHRPLRETFTHYKRYLLMGALVVAAGNVMSFLNLYMPTFAQKNLGIGKDAAFLASIFSSLICIIGPFISGVLADRRGVIPVMRAALIIGILMLFPLFSYLTNHPSFYSLALFQCGISLVFYSFYYAPVGALLSQLFPTSCRSSAVSITYVASQLFFGGITPLVVNYLVTLTGSIMSPIYYVICIGIVAFIALRFCQRRVTADTPSILLAEDR